MQVRCSSCSKLVDCPRDWDGASFPCPECGRPASLVKRTGAERPWPRAPEPEGSSRAVVAPDSVDPREDREKIRLHIAEHVGEPEGITLTEAATGFPLDIYAVPPSRHRRFFVLATAGISDQAMTAPPEERALSQHVELVIALPEHWKIDDKSPEWSWPIQQMASIACHVRMDGAYISGLHTFPNGDPLRPFAPNTKLCCILLGYPLLYDMRCVQVRPRKRVSFLSVHAIYEEEMNWMLRQAGTGIPRGRIFEKFVPNPESEILDISRENTCEKRFWFF